jgi:hypothetical protein
MIINMEQVELGSLIAGAVLSIVFAVIKRWVTLDKKVSGLIALAVSFLVASGFELVNDGWDWNSYISKVGQVYASSQLIYWVVLKELDLESVIEGK